MMTTTSDLFLSQMIYPELKTTHRLDPKGSHFDIWKFELNEVFIVNDVEYVLTTPIPDKGSDPVAHQKFLDDDLKARHIILGSLHDDLFLSYHHHETAEFLLDSLTSFFAKPSMARRMSLLNRYVGHKMAEGTATNNHVLKMSNMARELKREGVEVPGELQAVVLMNSFPDSRNDAISVMTMNMYGDKEELTLENVENRVRKTGGWKESFAESRAQDDEARSMSERSVKRSKRRSFRGHH